MSRQPPKWVSEQGYTQAQLDAAKQQIRDVIIHTAAQHQRIAYKRLCDRVTVIQLHPRSKLLWHLLASILADEKEPGGSGVAITAVVVNQSKGMPGGNEVEGFWRGARQAGFVFDDSLRFWDDSLHATWRLYG